MRGLQPSHLHIQEWYWVAIQNICDELCGLVILIDGKPTGMPSVSLASDFFDRYGLLCNHTENQALLTWLQRGQKQYVVDEPERPADEIAYEVFVPAGFAHTVLDLAEQGFVRITTTAELPYWRLIAHHLDGSQCTIERLQRYGPYIICR